MRVVRAIVIWACIEHLALANDASSMVQKNVQVSQATLQPREGGSFLPSSISLAFREVPAKFFMNVTGQEDMGAMRKHLLLSLRNKSYVGSMYAGLSNWSKSLGNFSSRLVKEAQKLMSESTNATQKRTFFLLEHYTLVMDDVVAELAGSTFSVLNQLLADAPPSKWRNATEQARAMFKTQTKGTVIEFISGNILRPQTKRIFDQKSAFCTRFMLAMSKNVDIDNTIASMVPGIGEMKASLSMLRPAINEVVPAIQGEVLSLLNTTLDAASRTFQGVNLAYHLMTKVMIEVASTKLNCTMPANNTQVLALAKKVDAGHCMPLSDPSMAACSSNIETAMKAPKSNVYGTMLEVVGVEPHAGTAEDFMRFHYCKQGDSNQDEVFRACSKAPCTCSKPPCDVCLSKAGAAVSDLMQSKAPVRHALLSFLLVCGSWLAL